MLSGDTSVVQASVLDGLSIDPFSFHEDSLAASEVDVGRRQIGDALVVLQMVVVGDELADLGVPSEYYVRQYSWWSPPSIGRVRTWTSR